MAVRLEVHQNDLESPTCDVFRLSSIHSLLGSCVLRTLHGIAWARHDKNVARARCRQCVSGHAHDENEVIGVGRLCLRADTNDTTTPALMYHAATAHCRVHPRATFAPASSSDVSDATQRTQPRLTGRILQSHESLGPYHHLTTLNNRTRPLTRACSDLTKPASTSRLT